MGRVRPLAVALTLALAGCSLDFDGLVTPPPDGGGDAASDATVDAGGDDGGTDTGPGDGGEVDTGPRDAGADTGPTDAGTCTPRCEGSSLVTCDGATEVPLPCALTCVAAPAPACMAASNGHELLPGEAPRGALRFDSATTDWVEIDTDNGEIVGHKGSDDVAIRVAGEGFQNDLFFARGAQGGAAPELALFYVTTFEIGAGVSVRVTGARPLAIVATGLIEVRGVLDVSAYSTIPNGVLFPNNAVGPGGAPGGDEVTPNGRGPGGGPGTDSSGSASRGGAGASFGSRGGAGGGGVGPMAPYGTAANIPLFGGSGGGRGGGNGGGAGGGGGGGLQLTSGTRVYVALAGGILAVGTGGLAGDGTAPASGGGGGGSGGAVLLEAPEVVLEGPVSVMGGGGGAGESNLLQSGGRGRADGNVAQGGKAGVTGGGGDGGDGSDPTTGEATAGGGGGLVAPAGGGGGGGAGRIRINLTDTAATFGKVYPLMGSGETTLGSLRTL